MNAKQVKTARTKLKLTKAEFARRVGVSRSAVTKWEDGKRNVSGMAQRIIQSLIQQVA